MTSDAIIGIRNLVQTYPGPDGTAVPVLNVPQLDVPAHGKLAVAGPSGTGKTTLFNIVAGLLRPTAGEVRVLGELLHQMSEARRDQFRAKHIGYIFQVANLLPGFSALENVLLAMSFARVIPPQQQRQRASDLLAYVGLADRLDYRPAKLSSGQQQRVAIARALANRPALLLADEPTAHVDYHTGQQIVSLLHATCAEQGAALLFASHDRALLATFPERIDLRPLVTDEQQLMADHSLYANSHQQSVVR